MDKENLVLLEQKYRELESFEERAGVIEQHITELEALNSSLLALAENPGKEMIVPLGKGVYLPVKSPSQEVFTSIGADVLVKKTPEKTRKIIEEQVNGLRRMREELEEHCEMLRHELQHLTGEEHNH